MHTSRALGALTFTFAATLVGCTAAHLPAPTPLEPGAAATEHIGPEGGSLDLGSLELIVPPGALPESTEITVTVEHGRDGIPFAGYSPVVTFAPAGLTFAAPIEVRIPYEGDPTRATVFWSQRDGDAWVARPTRIEGGFAITTSDHFSSAFVGTACEGEDCCDGANGELDVLLVVDNSNSMTEEQALLAAELPRLARILASGDRDEDGVQDFPALASIHLGVVSTDLGSGEYTVPSCELGFGDDGILFSTTSTPAPGCLTSYPSGVITYTEGTSSVEGFAQEVACIATLGVGGCGFEQQLEATLLALSPAAPTAYTAPGYAMPTFVGGRTGHGDGANAGLVRDHSILAIVELTDEADTSTADPSIFDPESPDHAGVPLNLRGTEVGGDTASALHPVSRYVDGLLALRTSPHDLVFAAVAGAPPELVSDPAHVDYDALLASPAMTETLAPEGNRLTEACATTSGLAFPARRIAATAAGIEAAGGATVLGSICEPNFTGLIDALLERISARAAGACE